MPRDTAELLVELAHLRDLLRAGNSLTAALQAASSHLRACAVAGVELGIFNGRDTDPGLRRPPIMALVSDSRDALGELRAASDAADRLATLVSRRLRLVADEAGVDVEPR